MYAWIFYIMVDTGGDKLNYESTLLEDPAEFTSQIWKYQTEAKETINSQYFCQCYDLSMKI